MAFLLWMADRARQGDWPRLRPVHVAMAVYLGAACLSLALARPRSAEGAAKLLGMVELAALMVVTSHQASRPGGRLAVTRVVAGTALLMAAAALTGEALFLAGLSTPLVASAGDLVPGHYARARAGLGLPAMLASFCVFAVALARGRDPGLSPWLRRVVTAALSVTVLATFSRPILAFALGCLVGAATTPGRRREAAAFAIVCAGVLLALTFWNVAIDPTRPWEASLRDTPSSRLQAWTSASRTLLARPLIGSGTGSSPGRRDGMPFDAHLTPLNIAAGLGLPALLGFSAIPIFLWRDRARPTNHAAWAGLAGMGLDALAQDVEDFRHLWVLFGLADSRRPAPAHPLQPEKRVFCGASHPG